MSIFKPIVCHEVMYLQGVFKFDKNDWAMGMTGSGIEAATRARYLWDIYHRTFGVVCKFHFTVHV
jgi:hypothetical protein